MDYFKTREPIIELEELMILAKDRIKKTIDRLIMVYDPTTGKSVFVKVNNKDAQYLSRYNF